MQLSILLGVLAVAITGTMAFYEPGTDLTHLCMMCGDPLVRMFSGMYVMITKEQKTLMSRWNRNDTDNCKFMLRMVSKLDHADDTDNDPLYVDWIGFNFAQHPNLEKFDQRWLFSGSHYNTMGRSGRKFTKGNLLVQSLPQAWPDYALAFPTNDTGHCLDATKDTDLNGNPMIKVRSDCCPYALNIYPKERGTCVELWTGDKYFEGDTIEGMCGGKEGAYNMDGTPVDFTEAGFDAMTASYLDGSNSGLGFPGGRRLGEPGFVGSMADQ